MKLLKDVSLKSKNTFHTNGSACNYYVPESEKDLIELLKTIQDNYYVLSGGSNILINDQKQYDNVIYMGEIDQTFKEIEPGLFYVGCSLRIQTVINKINDLGYGGIEEMYSIPGLFGGIIYMNAGIGSGDNILFNISNFIERVKVLNIKENRIEWLSRGDCKFSHRKSLFQNNEFFILGAEVKFIRQEKEISKKRIKDRLNKCKKFDMGNGTFGTVFSISNIKLLRVISFFHHRKGDVRFGNHNKNWFVNEGNATYKDTLYLIDKCKMIHKFFHKKIECEVRIWE